MLCWVKIRDETFRFRLFFEWKCKILSQCRERNKNDAPHWSVITNRSAWKLYCTVLYTIDHSWVLPDPPYKFDTNSTLQNEIYWPISIKNHFLQLKKNKKFNNCNFFLSKQYFTKIGLKKNHLCFADKPPSLIFRYTY